MSRSAPTASNQPSPNREKAEDIILRAIILLIAEKSFSPEDIATLAKAYTTLRSAPS